MGSTHRIISEPASERSSEPAPEALPVSTPRNDAESPAPYTVYSGWQKVLLVAAAAIGGFYNPLTAQVYLPALNVLADEFNVTPSKINLTVTTYMIFQGVTPTLFSGFTDALGRRPAYIICFLIYIPANIGLALADRYRQLLIVRCLQSAGSATIMVLSQAVVADTITSAERGSYVALTGLPIILGPSIGPVIGGAMAMRLGWRSIFWMLTICAGINFALLLIFLPETCRKVVGDGSVRPPAMYRTLWQAVRYRRRRHHGPFGSQNFQSLEKPAYDTGTVGTAAGRSRSKRKSAALNLFSSFMLLRDVELCLLLLIGGVVFSGVYAIGTAVPHHFKQMYDFNPLEIGLMYLPMAAGAILATAVIGPGMNYNYRRHARKLGIAVDRKRKMDLADFPIEKVRLQITLPLLLLSVAVVLCWGWITANRADVEEVCALVFAIGFALVGVNNTVNSLIVDIYPERSGAALAAYNLAKCSMGALATAVINPMINAVGFAYAFTVFGGLYLLLVPVTVLVMKKGMGWREARRTRAGGEQHETHGDLEVQVVSRNDPSAGVVPPSLPR
ncbi:major facilitator superfamily domain-containing protein [Cladorrhinum samala]|uniref:Major facilitator superfamily domain-containing protein n=1 Tax=Cladorrhinum samala TaxID=585594 RepID=A0AAV9HJA7_9PEZI|nr:major facilitator superfamily domain-containing protein [Cladorrhinum samala]